MPEIGLVDAFIVLKILSNFLRFLGVVLIIPAIIAIYYGEIFYAEVFLYMALILTVSFSISYFLLGKKETKIKHAIVAIALGWFVVGAVSMIPFVIWGMDPVDAYFESISGWSTTGLTMIEKPEVLPYSLNFWRGFIQWLGGFGIVILALMFYERPKTAQELFRAEGRSEDFYINFSKIARLIVGIYTFYTLLGIILFLLSGMALFDATVHAFTTIATGGFSTRSEGLGSFGLRAMVSAVIIMLAGGISFVSHRELLKGNFCGFFSNPEIKLMFAILFSFTVLIFFSSLTPGIFYAQFFYAVSALTGTGATADITITQLQSFTIFVIILLMISGACYGSTAGAIKLWRTLIAFKVVRREIYRALLPQQAVIPLRVGNKVLSDENALNALAYIALYVALLLGGSILFMLAGYTAKESIFLVASAQGNVGLNIISGQAWFNMNWVLKILLCFHMILGRMEIIPFLILLRSFGVIRRV
ncbi:MAG: TrkH family potassium uptake protein [Candidatus Diapherotrites archaeon]